MKILYVTTIGITMTFFKELSKDLLDRGHTLDVITNEDIAPVPECYREWPCRIFHHDCARSPFSMGNLRAIRQIRSRVLEGGYDIVHCHTPIASFCTRLACIGLRKKGVKVVYTAHGFHFYKGAPLKNWLLYYTAEKLCAPLTDLLITINHEDFERAKQELAVKAVEYVPGVGINTEKFARTTIDKAAKRRELGVPEDAFLLASVGELNDNKNHQLVIRAMAELDCPEMHYVIAGEGPLLEHLTSLARELGVGERVHLLGLRTDVAEIYKAADIFCFPSIREGLPVSTMEAMAAGLPLVAAINRGTVELVADGDNGLLCTHEDVRRFEENISRLQKDPQLRQQMGQRSAEKAKAYDVQNIVAQMKQIYTAL